MGNCEKKTIVIAIGLVISLLFAPLCAKAIPAFPGAEGFGESTIGGRGGAIVKVTNLNDSGPGSFRAAVTAPVPRIILFEVSGIINLVSDVNILTPYITIAGQSSPGGICIAGATVMVNTHDVIIRHMRFRPGTNRVVYERDGAGNIIYYNQINKWPTAPGACKGDIVPGDFTDYSFPCPLSGGMDPELIHGLLLLGKGYGSNMAYNIMVDHCSTSWGVDETFGTSAGTMSTTIQWTIISEGLSKAGHSNGEHSKGLMVSGKPNRYDNAVTLHHNYIAHNTDRNPMMFSPQDLSYPLTTTIDGINNISYDWKGLLSAWNEEIPHTNWVYNYAKPGVNSNSAAYEVTFYAKPNVFPTPFPLLYVKGNIGASRLTQSVPDWNVGWYYTTTLCPQGWSKPTPWNAPPVTTAVMSTSVANCILTGVGATAPVRDSVDKRVVADFAAGTGTRKLNVKYPDDYPTFTTPPPPTDSDNDGMPDSWETAHGLDNSGNDSALDRDNDGYTNIEEYINYLSDKSYVFNSECMPGPLTPIIKSININ